MKYAICYGITDLQSKSIANVTITENPLQALKNLNISSVRMFYAEKEAPEISSLCIIKDSTIFLENGQNFGVTLIDLCKLHPIIFDPDRAYETLGTGHIKTCDLLNVDPSEDSMLLFVDTLGPSEWERACISDGEVETSGVTYKLF